MVTLYRMIQLDFTLEIGAFCILLDITLSIFTILSLKRHMECFNFRCRIHLGHLFLSLGGYYHPWLG